MVSSSLVTSERKSPFRGTNEYEWSPLRPSEPRSEPFMEPSSIVRTDDTDHLRRALEVVGSDTLIWLEAFGHQDLSDYMVASSRYWSDGDLPLPNQACSWDGRTCRVFC